MPLIRKNGLRIQLKMSTTTKTKEAKPIFCNEPNASVPLAPKPPPKSVMPMSIKLKPINNTTTPLTVGVITRFK